MGLLYDYALSSYRTLLYRQPMTIAHIIEGLNIATAICSNATLIVLSLRFSKPHLGTYKYLLMIFASCDMFLTVIHAIIRPKVFDFETTFTMFSAAFPDDTMLSPIYVSCFTVPLALSNINFLYRYWAVKTPAKLIRFTEPAFVGLLAMYPLGQAVGWSWIAFQNDLDASHYVQDFYYAHYNETITGWRVMRHWENDRFNLRAFAIIFAAVLVMTVNFSIAIFLASQTIAHLRKANAFTANNKAKQIAILRALFAQASVPILFVYIPFGCAILSPFLGLDFLFPIANATMTMTSFFPAWDAIVIILLIKDYRDGLVQLITRNRSSVSSAQTTVWNSSTQMISFSSRVE